MSFNGRAEFGSPHATGSNDENRAAFIFTLAVLATTALASDTESEKPAEPKFEVTAYSIRTQIIPGIAKRQKFRYLSK